MRRRNDPTNQQDEFDGLQVDDESTLQASGAFAVATTTDSGKVVKKTSDFASRKLRAEKEVKKVFYITFCKLGMSRSFTPLKNGLWLKAVSNDFLEKHMRYGRDNAVEDKSENDNVKEDYLPPLPAFKITSRNNHTYLGASDFLAKEFHQEAEIRSKRRKLEK